MVDIDKVVAAGKLQVDWAAANRYDHNGKALSDLLTALRQSQKRVAELERMYSGACKAQADALRGWNKSQKTAMSILDDVEQLKKTLALRMITCDSLQKRVAELEGDNHCLGVNLQALVTETPSGWTLTLEQAKADAMQALEDCKALSRKDGE